MRLVVTGAAGGLGRAFLDVVPEHHDVHAFAHADLDIGDHHAVMRTVPLLRPDAIVNLAAFTHVDDNEDDPARSFRDNASGPQSLALAARSSGATLLHVSTDYVFDGEKGAPYDEADEPRPLSTYGRAKLLGERLVRQALREHVIVRTGYVFGGGDDYVSGAVERLRRGDAAGGMADRVGTPTYVRHLAERLIPLLLAGRPGTYHLSGPEPTTWLDVLERCARIGDLPGTVRPQRSADLRLRAARPANSALTSVLLSALDLPPMPALDAALAAFLGR